MGAVKLKSKILPASAWAPKVMMALETKVMVAGLMIAGRGLQKNALNEGKLKLELVQDR